MKTKQLSAAPCPSVARRRARPAPRSSLAGAARLRACGVADAAWIGIDTCADEGYFSNRRAFQRGEPDYGRLLSAIMLV